MSQEAKVFWQPAVRMMPPTPLPVSSGAKERGFDSLDAAVRFVMEVLPEPVRCTATIRTENACIQYADLVRIYHGAAGRA